MIVLALLAGTLATLHINGVILNPISTVIALLAIPPVTTIFTSINKKYIENMESALECLDNLKQEIPKEQTITKSKKGIITLDIEEYIDKVEDALIENKNKPKTKVRKK